MDTLRKTLKKIILLFSLTLIIVIIGVLCFTYSSSMTAILPGATEATTEPADPYAEQIKALQDELANSNLSEETRKLEQEKLDTISIMATQKAGGRIIQPTRSENGKSTPEGLIVGEKLPDGIDENPPVPFSEQNVSVINSWRKTTEDNLYLVYSGFLTQDTDHGALLVLHSNTHDFQEYVTPSKNGKVKIIGNQGDLIVLQAEDGTRFYFDFVSEYFVSTDGKPIPSPTMAPTHTVKEDVTPTVENPYP